MILVFAWALSGPIAAAALSFLFAGMTFYLFLVTKEPVFLLQIFFYALYYAGMVYYLLVIQRKNNHKQISWEKIVEECRWIEDEISRKDSLKKALENKVDRFLGLSQFSEELKSAKDLETATRKITKKAQESLGHVEECALYLVDESNQQLSLASAETYDGSAIKEKEGSIFDQWVMKNSQGLLIEDTRNDFRFPSQIKPGDRSLRSVCASPLMTENKVLGVVRVGASAPNVFDSDDLRLLDIFSNLGSVTLKNLLLYAKMKEMAIHDGLTGLYLKRYFEERFSEEKKRADYSRAPFGLIMIDIDHFKNYNDQYGHSAGDIVLKSIAAFIVACLEPSALVARYGGEEFIVLLPNKTREETRLIAENLRAAIEANKFVFRRIQGRVTISLGVVEYPRDGRSEEELIRNVDKYLYQAKKAGRNQTCGNW